MKKGVKSLYYTKKIKALNISFFQNEAKKG